MKDVKGISYDEYFASGHRACAGCGEALVLRHIMKAAGSNTIVAQATGCMEVVSTPYPQTAWKVPWVHGAFENAAAIASGIDRGLIAQGKREGVNIIAMGGDGASFDIGFGALSGAMERGHKFTYIATDNEAYMNTGVQRSGATFPYASTTTSPDGKKIHGKQEPKKPLAFIVAAHGLNYVASMSPANLFDMKKKVETALSRNHTTFLHAYCVCPVGWHCKSADTMELSRLAIQTRVFPLYEIDNGVLQFNQKVEKPKPVKEYLELQGRFRHVNEEEVEKIQKYVNDRYDFLLSIEGKKAFDVLY